MVREMDLADVLALFEYWADYPAPGDILRVIAASWGWKPPTPKRTAVSAQGSSPLQDFPHLAGQVANLNPTRKRG